MVGTESYLAPEIRQKKGFSGCKPDLFALGVVLFTMHFGQTPWQETTEKDKIFSKYQRKAVNLFRYHPASKQKFAAGLIDPDMLDLILKLLAFSPKERPESLHEVLEHPFFSKIKENNIAQQMKALLKE